MQIMPVNWLLCLKKGTGTLQSPSQCFRTWCNITSSICGKFRFCNQSTFCRDWSIPSKTCVVGSRRLTPHCLSLRLIVLPWTSPVGKTDASSDQGAVLWGIKVSRNKWIIKAENSSHFVLISHWENNLHRPYSRFEHVWTLPLTVKSGANNNGEQNPAQTLWKHQRTGG